MSIENRNGLFWPTADRECYEAVLSTVADVHKGLKHVKGKKNVAIQAGGNCGIWARELAPIFDTVYTFEPDPTNFACLVHNAPRKNVIKFQACLGLDHVLVDLAVNPKNIGANYVSGPGRIPVLKIDDLALDACDFIQLDVEGFEGFALKGAENTLKKFGPVLMLELKGLGDKFNFPDSAVLEYLSQLDYKVVDRVHRDTILARG